MPGPTEKELDAALAKELENNADFARWIQGQTKNFANLPAKLAQARSDNPWGKFPFEQRDAATGGIVSTSAEGETDVLAIYETDKGLRFALHIENKRGGGRFRPSKAALYAARARHWCGNPNYGNYTEWETVLVAPRAFYECYREDAAKFSTFISHEDIARFIPLFKANG